MRPVTQQFVIVPITLLPYLGGLIPGPVRSDMTWKHLHCVPLSMNFICPEDIFCNIPIKRALFPLAQFHIVSLAPMGEILQIGRTSWRFVSESHSRQPSWVKFLTKKLTKVLPNPLMN